VADTIFSDSVEPDYYPNSKIFINLLGVTSAQELRQKEAVFTAIRSIELLQSPDLTPQTYGFSALKFIHHYLFQDLYEWAGKPRSFDMYKNGDVFTLAKDLPKYESDVFNRAINFCKSDKRPSIEEAAIKLASCLGIINI